MEKKSNKLKIILFQNKHSKIIKDQREFLKQTIIKQYYFKNKNYYYYLLQSTKNKKWPFLKLQKNRNISWIQRFIKKDSKTLATKWGVESEQLINKMFYFKIAKTNLIRDHLSFDVSSLSFSF